MVRLIQLLLSPASRMVRLAAGEKRIPCTLVQSEDAAAHLPVWIEEAGYSVTGIWAIVDHLENTYPEPPLLPEDPGERGEALRLLDWTMTIFQEEITRRIVFEKAPPAQTGSSSRRPPNMETIRLGRAALRTALPALGALAESHGFLSGRHLTLADLALASHFSALDYYGEIPWTDFPAVTEWYYRLKSRPSFRTLLTDRVPGQPPVPNYGELDF
jgi:glutathione S-transferase